MRNIFVQIVLLLTAATPHLSGAEGADARAIMDRVDARYEGKTQTSKMEMILIDRSAQQKVRRLHSFTQRDETVTKRLLVFDYPPDVKGSGFLTYDYKAPETDDDQWLYLPALQKVKRIASTERSQSFMGSDFSYGDLKKKDVSRYDYRLLKSTEVEGRAVWVIEAVPKGPETVEETGYTKSIFFVRKDIDFVIRAVHFMKEGSRQKYFDVEVLKKIDGVWTAMRSTMTTRQGRKQLHRTVLTLEGVVYDGDIDSALLTLRGLKRG